MTTRHLSTFDAVLDAVGGFRPLAELTGVSTPLTYAWRREGRLPAWTLDRIERELALHGLTVARAVFNFEPARAGKKRANARRSSGSVNGPTRS